MTNSPHSSAPGRREKVGFAVLSLGLVWLVGGTYEYSRPRIEDLNVLTTVLLGTALVCLAVVVFVGVFLFEGTGDRVKGWFDAKILALLGLLILAASLKAIPQYLLLAAVPTLVASTALLAGPLLARRRRSRDMKN